MSWEYRGILPAMQLPFEHDLSIDEVELRRFARWLAGHKGIGGLVTNGHTGEVFALSAEQRAKATRIVADEVGRKLPQIVLSVAAKQGVDPFFQIADGERVRRRAVHLDQRSLQLLNLWS